MSGSTLLPHHTLYFRIKSPLQKHTLIKVRTVSSIDYVKTSSLYQVLRIKETASPSEIKVAYRNLAKLYHPDAASQPNTTHHFIAIHNAYATLSDPLSRARYDLSIAHHQQATHSGINTSSQSFRSTKRWETDQCW
ncbi:hypothetical protein ACOSQ3_016076 [Xanthoceras sorbifolium]